jgi:flagellar biogenesis protein FliO
MTIMMMLHDDNNDDVTLVLSMFMLLVLIITRSYVLIKIGRTTQENNVTTILYGSGLG